MENDNRVCRLGGIRRIFDKPPPRLLKIFSSDFFSSGAIIVFRFCAFFLLRRSLKDKVGPHLQLLHHTQSYAIRQIFVIKTPSPKAFRDKYVDKAIYKHFDKHCNTK